MFVSKPLRFTFSEYKKITQSSSKRKNSLVLQQSAEQLEAFHLTVNPGYTSNGRCSTADKAVKLNN